MDTRPSGDTRVRASIPGPSDDPADSGARPSQDGNRIGGSRILPGAVYSLKDAADLSGVPENRLRRAILFEDLQAEDVPDERQYLIRGQVLAEYLRAPQSPAARRVGNDAAPDPSPSAGALFFVLTVIIIVLLILAAVTASPPAGPHQPGRASEKIETPALPQPPAEGPAASPSW